MRYLFKIPVLLAALSVTTVLHAAEAPLAGDTFLSATAPATAQGGATALSVGSGSTALVQFDLSGCAPTTTVTSAYLRIFIDKVTTPGPLGVALVTSPWTEGSAVLNTPPTMAAPFATINASTPNAFLLVNVTAQVQTWIANPGSNLGFAITSAGAAVVALDSKENTLTSHPPALDITTTGTPGASGPTGPAGVVGAAGPAGAAGAAGPNGPPGPTGPAGVAGATGAAGTAGAAGPTGSTGPAGPTGLTGAAGAVGAAGAGGPAGPLGPAGPQGLAGPAGAVGGMGANGPVGPLGPAGPTGSQGVAGVAGPKGPTGATGPPGATGAAGATGSAGPQGLAGSNGPTGPVGATGAQGTNGPLSNVYPFDTTVHPNGFQIPANDTNIYYLADYTAGTSLFKLPAGQPAGRKAVVLSKTAVSSANQIGFQTVGTDRIIDNPFNTTSAGAASFTAASSLTVVCDGAGHWYVTWQQ